MNYIIFEDEGSYCIKATMDGDEWFNWKEDTLYKCIEEIKRLTGNTTILLENEHEHSHASANIDLMYDR